MKSTVHCPHSCSLPILLPKLNAPMPLALVRKVRLVQDSVQQAIAKQSVKVTAIKLDKNQPIKKVRKSTRKDSRQLDATSHHGQAESLDTSNDASDPASLHDDLLQNKHLTPLDLDHIMENIEPKHILDLLGMMENEYFKSSFEGFCCHSPSKPTCSQQNHQGQTSREEPSEVKWPANQQGDHASSAFMTGLSPAQRQDSKKKRKRKRRASQEPERQDQGENQQEQDRQDEVFQELANLLAQLEIPEIRAECRVDDSYLLKWTQCTQHKHQ